jgi:hypothetical protein
MAGAKEL